MKDAANLIGKDLTLICGFRLPPTLHHEKAGKLIKEILEKPGEETFGAKVEVQIIEPGNGLDPVPLP